MYENRGLILTASGQSPRKREQRNKNVHLIRSLFARCAISCRTARDCTEAALPRLLQTAFPGASRQSVSYLYINCPGTAEALSLGAEGESLLLEELWILLEDVPGTKVVLLALDPLTEEAPIQLPDPSPQLHVLAGWEGADNALTERWCGAVGCPPFGAQREQNTDPRAEDFVTLAQLQAQCPGECRCTQSSIPVFGPEAVHEGMLLGAPQPLRKNAGLILSSWNGADPNEPEQRRREQDWLMERRVNSCELARTMLQRSGIVVRTVMVSREKSLKSYILEQFADATENSVSYLYIACRCNADGLVIYRSRRAPITVSFRELRETLDQISGTKIVLLSCFRSPNPLSLGSFQVSAGEVARRAVDNMLRAFRQSRMRDGVCGPAIHVLAACELDPESGEKGPDNASLCTRLWEKMTRLEDGAAVSSAAGAGGFLNLSELREQTLRLLRKEGVDGACGCYPEQDLLPALGNRAFYPELFIRETDSLEACGALHSKWLGQPAGEQRQAGDCLCRDYENGVTVRYGSGTVEAFHALRFIPVALHAESYADQPGLHLRVSVLEDGRWRVRAHRIPQAGGLSPAALAPLTPDGAAIDWKTTARSLDGYQTQPIHSDSVTEITLELQNDREELLDLMTLRLTMENGWGLLLPAAERCTSFFQGGDTSLTGGAQDTGGTMKLDYILTRVDG